MAKERVEYRAIKPGAGETKPRKRLSAELRRAELLDTASAMVVKQGFLPLSVEALARAASASKALVYAYFPTQYDLFNALLEREIAGLATAGFDTASRIGDVEQAAVLCGMLYFEHVAQRGPLLHILLTDRYMVGHIDARATRAGRGMLQRIVRLARTTLKLREAEIRAAIEMIAAVPEEAGTLAYRKELDLALARQLCHTLMLSSVRALRSPRRIAIGSDNAA